MQRILLLTGMAGLAASLIVGVGEFLLHFDPLSRFSSGGYDFLTDIGVNRSSTGHFLGVFGATLYPVGCYHIYLMLKDGGVRLAFISFLLSSFGFIVGAVWIGSRASISALAKHQELDHIEELISLYVLRYETLLWVIRITTLILSIVIIVMCVKGKTRYPAWIAFFNPIAIIVACFALFLMIPSVGKYLMPIALNVAFFVFFSLSLIIVVRSR